MKKIVCVPILTILAAGILPADQAASFFDDSAVREVRLYFDDTNWYNTLYQSHNSNPDDPYFPVRFQYGDITLSKVGVRFKGNSSFRRNGVKKSFKLDFNEYDDNVTFLGLKKLNLNNGDLQPDFLHEKLFLDFAGKYIAAMRAVHVRLYVNDVYYGLYIGIEQPDKVMMQSRFGSGEDGNLYEAGENVAANMSYLGANVSSYTSRYELKTNEEDNDYSGLISLLDILNNTAAADLPSKLEPLMDVENVLYGMALNALFTNLESYVGTASEYFLYDRSSDGRFIHIHWDLNETFGSTGDGTPRLSNPFTMDAFYLPTGNIGGPGGGGGGGTANNARPLLQKLWAVDAYKQLYLQMLARMLREGFDEKTFAARIEKLAALIRTDYYADTNKAYTNAQFETALTGQVTANGFTTYGLTQFVRERGNYLRPVLNAAARASDVRLNELVSSGTPWVELHNLGPGPVTTTSFYISDDASNPSKWAVPVQSLADGDFLVVSLEGKILASSGTLTLYAGTTAIDSVAYRTLASGQSYSRTGIYGSVWNATSTVTKGAANSITTATNNAATGTGQLLINEFMADNDAAFPDPDEQGAYEDWFEVYNPGTATVDMSGMYISDNLNNPTKWKVPDGVMIRGGEHLVFLADGDTTQGSRHTSWSLSADGESIGIYQTDGTTLIDSVTFGPQRTDVAYGRTNDGASGWSLFAPATPGAANANPIANWILNGASYQVGVLAPESIVSAFTQGLGSTGVTVALTDSAGVARTATLYFSAAGQVNFQMPAGAASGRGRITIGKPDGTTTTGDVLIDAIAPGIFSANANGTGVALVAAVRADAQGNQTALTAFRYDSTQQKYLTAPISLGAETDQVYLVMYGTGIRGVKALSSVSAQIGGVNVPVTYAAAQSQFAGLDQINLGPLPRTLLGKGEVAIVLTVDGNRVNSVTIQIE